MHLTDHDLLQLDSDTLSRLDEEALRRLSGRLLDDLNEARDRLNQDSKNSSRPPGSDYFPERSKRDRCRGDPASAVGEDFAETVPEEPAPQKSEAAAGRAPDESGGAANARNPPPVSRPSGRQSGAPGHGRRQSLPITATCLHRPKPVPAVVTAWMNPRRPAPMAATMSSTCCLPIRPRRV